jgi:Resolvase, N terminal domain
VSRSRLTPLNHLWSHLPEENRRLLVQTLRRLLAQRLLADGGRAILSPPESHSSGDPPRRGSGPSAPLPEPLGSPPRPAKIQPRHLERLAMVYVRQSSPHQVLCNKESAEVQARLRDQAIAWGWPPERVTVITGDQARSGTTTAGRHHRTWMVTEVNLNHVGIILGFQVSRLSRANKDWYDLLERCAVFHTLLADQDGLYDPTEYNDRLLLGLK